MSGTKKVVINTQFGGFGLSEAAYEKLIEWGVPVRGYVSQKYNTTTGLYEKEPRNDGEVVLDDDLTERDEETATLRKAMRTLRGRYWDSGWTEENREHPLIVRVVGELGDAANGPHASLKIVEVPASIEYEIDEYDGNEHVAEKHRTWR